MLPVLIAVLAGVSGGLIGWSYSRKLVKRRKYFEQFSSFVSALTADVGFTQNNLATIVKRFLPSCDAELNYNLNEFLSFVAGEMNEPNLSRHVLTESEYNYIKNFFSALGRYDLSTQLRLLDGDKARLDELCRKSREKEEKQAISSVKLGALIGLMIGIVIL